MRRNPERPKARPAPVLPFPERVDPPDRVHDEIIVSMGSQRFRISLDAKITEIEPAPPAAPRRVVPLRGDDR